MKPTIPQGTRDFNAATVRKRQHIFHTIQSVFELYGYEPLETPAMENLETLMGKYGEEGDKLIFKILNNGLDNPTKHKNALKDFNLILEGNNIKGITERALRYDLTIPFARYVAMNHGQLTMPYKRFQMQPVWRADRPQRGRYREFYQCDADVVGSKSLLNEIELANIYSRVFEKLGIEVEIKINNRKILVALAELCGGTEKMLDITISIDKLDKIGIEKVKEELLQKGLNNIQVKTIEEYLNIEGSNQEKISTLKKLIDNIPIGKTGIEELEYILNYSPSQLKNKIIADFTLARGLNYYTGTIFEVTALNIQMGSIGGGGRYDDLTGLFGVPNIPGVGISFGVDRIYDVMEEQNLFSEELTTSTQVLFFNLGATESKKSFSLMQELRSKNIRCEMYHEETKMDKQFKFADKKNIPFVIILGSRELEKNNVVIKNIKTGVQQTVALNELINFDFKD